MPQFEVSTYFSQIFWLTLTFCCLYFVISKFITPTFEGIFRKRKLIINQAVEEAENLATTTEALKKEFDNGYTSILAAAEDIKKESLDNLNNIFNKRKSILLEDLSKEKEKTINEIENNLNLFTSSQQESCIDLAKFIIKKITNKEVDLKVLENCYERVK